MISRVGPIPAEIPMEDGNDRMGTSVNGLATNDRKDGFVMREEGIPEEIIEAIADGVPPVRAFRVDTEITVGELAEDTGIPPSRIDAIEDGAMPKPEELEAIGEALHVPPDVLLPSPAT